MTLRSSATLFRDLLNAEDHVELKAKHDAAAFIRKYLIDGKITEGDLSVLCGLTPPQVSKIVGLRLQEFSIDELNGVSALLRRNG
jgi:predicted XRE-type DNA-binding protein